VGLRLPRSPREQLRPTVEHVDDPADPRLADNRDLRDVMLRRTLEVEHGLFLAEGEKVVRRAVDAGHRPRSFLLAERWFGSLADVVVASGAPGARRVPV